MTIQHKLIAAALIGLLLLTGFIVGRTTISSATSAAEASPATLNHTDAQPANTAQPAGDVASRDQFYLSDFKTGYNDGFQAGTRGLTGPSTVETDRAGYNEGYKEGYTDAYQAQAGENGEPDARPGVRTASRERVVYRTVNQPVYRTTARKGRSKLKTALTIGAPAAIGAGIGAMFAGKKGAGIGALIGGGGGAIYELRKRRDR
jgi:hypothetical protein